MAPQELVEAQLRLLQEPIASDITVKCGDQVWRCNSAILSQRCEFFRAVCQGNFMESQTKVIELTEDKYQTPELIGRLLMYLYTLDTEVFTSVAHALDDRYAEAAYLLGDRYLLPQLREAGKGLLLHYVRNGLPHFGLYDNGIGSERAWTTWMQEVWDWGTLPGVEELKKSIIDNLTANAAQVIDNKHFRALMQDREDISQEFLQDLAKKAGTKEGTSGHAPTCRASVQESFNVSKFMRENTARLPKQQHPSRDRRIFRRKAKSLFRHRNRLMMDLV